MSPRALLAVAILGPGFAGIAAVLPFRWVRRILALAVAGVALAAAALVLARAYDGRPPVWRSFRAGLFPATMLVALHLGSLLAGLRAVLQPRSGERLALAGLAVGTAAAGVALTTTSIPVLGMALGVPTVGVLAATLSGGPRALFAPGLIGLAAADVLAIAGLTVLAHDTGSAVLAPGRGIGPAAGLLLAAGALKSGAVPLAGAWGAGSGEPPQALAQVPLRVQGLALIALVPLLIGRTGADAPTIAAGAGLALLCGLSALLPGRALPGAAGVGAAAALFAAGLGGAVGARAFVLLAPVLAVAWGAAWMLFAHEGEDRPSWWAPAAVAGGLALAVPLLLPPAGGFPGGWLALTLAAIRAAGEPAYLLAAGSVLAGCGLGTIAVVRLMRSARASALALPGLAVAAGSLYLGVASGPLALGWLARVELSLPLPALLPTAGAPAIPPARIVGLALAVAPAVVLAGVVVALARGLRAAPPGTGLEEREAGEEREDALATEEAVEDTRAPEREPVKEPEEPEEPGSAGSRRGNTPAERVRWVVAGAGRAAATAGRWLQRARAAGSAWGAVILLEGAAAVLAVRLVVVGASTGFL